MRSNLACSGLTSLAPDSAARREARHSNTRKVENMSTSAATRVRVDLSTSLLLMVILPIGLHAYWFAGLVSDTRSLRGGEDVVLTSLPRPLVRDPSTFPVRILATYGDVFQPRRRDSSRTYDLIVVSATLNPLEVHGDSIAWTSNLMVRTALAYASTDPTLAPDVVRSLLSGMMQSNRLFFERLLSVAPTALEREGAYVARLCEPRFLMVPAASRLGQEGVRVIAFVPLFDGGTIRDNAERRIKLGFNVRTAVARTLDVVSREIAHERMPVIRSVGLPALAGTQTLSDSTLFLSYFDSFSEILDAISGQSLPVSIETLHLVAWDKFNRVRGMEQEEAAPLAALARHHARLSVADHYSRLAALTIAFVSIVFAVWIAKLRAGNDGRTLPARLRAALPGVAVAALLCVSDLVGAAGYLATGLASLFRVGGHGLLLLGEVLIAGVCTVLVREAALLPFRESGAHSASQSG